MALKKKILKKSNYKVCKIEINYLLMNFLIHFDNYMQLTDVNVMT